MDMPRPQPRPCFLVLVGPSGVGKSTVIDAVLRRRPDCIRSRSSTTRAPRGQERQGVDYDFVSPELFKSMIAEDAFLEYAQVFGANAYGTPRAFIEAQLAAGKTVIKDIDIQGARQVRQRLGERCLSVFLAPPNWQSLEARLRGRGTDSPEAIEQRLQTAREELAAWRECQFVVVNHTVEQAADDLCAIVRVRELATH